MIPVNIDNCRGWFHEARGGLGVVMCAAHGFEELCSRHSWRILAERLARSGIPTLRFDYEGCGDSTGLDGDPNRVAAWLANVNSSVEWMKSHGGVETVALAGLRLGALLATWVAAERRDITRLALLAPVLSGAAYGRELRLASRIMTPPESEGMTRENLPGALDVCGFETTDRTLDELRDLDMMKLASAPARRILTLECGEGPGEAAARRHLEMLGAAVTRLPFRNYRQMMLPPIDSRPCMSDIEAVVKWFGADRVQTSRPSSGAITSKAISERNWSDVPIQFGANGRLVGILCTPERPAPERPCLIILNSGRDYHAGWARSAVLLARQLADVGIASLRFDPEGIGDSLSDPLWRRARLYSSKSRPDVIAAIDLIEARGYRNIALFGACSGAYLAFHTALADTRVKALALRNLERFVWRVDDFVNFTMVDQFGSVIRAGTANGVANAGWRAKSLARLGSCLRIAKRAAAAAIGRVALLHNDPARVEGWIGDFTKRGGRLLLVHSSNNSGRAHLDRMLGKDGARVQGKPGIDIRFIDGADHNFTGRGARAEFDGDLADFLLERDGARSNNRDLRKEDRPASHYWHQTLDC